MRGASTRGTGTRGAGTRPLSAVRTSTGRARVVAASLTLGALFSTTACGQAALSRDRLQTAVTGTFTNLYALRQQQLGRPAPSAAALATTARCDKGGPNVADEGPGDAWTCLVVWQADGPGTPIGATYEVKLATNGCYTADGPPSTVGQRQAADAEGALVLNPIASFDGCFDTT